MKSSFSIRGWLYDLPGYITLDNLIGLIRDDYSIPKGAFPNGKIPVDADNYCCQAGDLRRFN